MLKNHDPNPSGPGIPPDDDNEVIELTRIVEVGSRAPAFPDPPVEDGNAMDERGENETLPDLGRLALEVTGDIDESAEGPDAGSRAVTLPLAQLEQALEKVVNKLYAGSIESMVLDVIEKTVQREITKINALIAEAAKKEG